MRLTPSPTPVIHGPSGGGNVSLAPVLGRGPQGLPGPGSAAWTAGETVTTGTVRQAPDGSRIVATANRTTGATFDATERGFWTSVATTPGTKENADLSASFAQPTDSRVKPDRNLAGFPVATNAWAQGSTYGTTVTSGTGKTAHIAAVDCSDIRVVYGAANSAGGNGDTDAAGSIAVRAALEVNGVLYRITFGGRTDVTVDPGAIVTSDPVTVDLPKGTKFYVRTYRSSSFVPNATTASYAGSGTGGFVGSVDLTDPASAAAVPDGGAFIWGPRAIIGTPANRTTPSVLIVGDSIAAGYQDGPTNSGDLSAFSNTATLAGGYVCRGLNNQVGWINIAQSGEAAVDFVSTSRSARRMAYANGCTHAIVDYGRNDLDRGRTLAQIKADLLTIWNRLAARGLRVHQTTITPKTTSTDSWATTAGQTVVSSESIRVALNDWIRTKPAPLTGYFDAADASETGRNSGIWKAGYTGDGIHPNPTGAAGAAASIDPTALTFTTSVITPTAGPATPSTSTIYASDGFDRANGSLGSTPVGNKAWTALKGALTDWTVASNKAHFVSTAAGESIVTVNTQADGRIIATLTSAPTGGSDTGIVFRATDASNLWLLWTQGGGVYKLMKLVGGAYTTVVTSTVTAAAGDKIRIDMAGAVNTVYVNGTQIANTQDGFGSLATQHGLRVSAAGVGNVADFDNFQHASIPS